MIMTLKRKNKKGFTLIELIVVVAIIAILAAIAVPSFIGLQQKAEDAVLIADAATLAGQINVYNALSTTHIGSGSASTAQATLDGEDLAPVLTGGNTFAEVFAVLVWDGDVAKAPATITHN